MHDFEDMRPYRDDEVPAAIERIIANPAFPAVAIFLYPDLPTTDVMYQLSTITTKRQFQDQVMRRAIERMLTVSNSTFTYTVSPRLQHDASHIFIANHRAIVLDAMLLQRALFDSGFESSQIIYGNNLINIPFMSEASRINKMVGIERGGNPMEFYRNLLRTSSYIRNTITSQHESVWIAQGNGRTKNGTDTTDPAIIKMLSISTRKPISEAIVDLCPAPITVSYEWEPCDFQKAIEILVSRNGKYKKAPDEDFRSTMTDLVSHKGEICMTIGDPIFPDQIAACNNDTHKIAHLIDVAIMSGYHLFANNFIAHDLRSASTTFASRYNDEQREAFLAHLDDFCQRAGQHPTIGDTSTLQQAKEILLGIYANPIDNILRLGIEI